MADSIVRGSVELRQILLHQVLPQERSGEFYVKDRLKKESTCVVDMSTSHCLVSQTGSLRTVSTIETRPTYGFMNCCYHGCPQKKVAGYPQ